jgi:hypothetical protein
MQVSVHAAAAALATPCTRAHVFALHSIVANMKNLLQEYRNLKPVTVTLALGVRGTACMHACMRARVRMTASGDARCSRLAIAIAFL